MGKDSKNPFDTRSIDNSMFQGASPHAEADVSRAVFDANPNAVFVLNRNFQILDCNAAFRDAFPAYESGKKQYCYRLVPPDERETPCPDCLARKSFLAGQESTCEFEEERNGAVMHYRKKAIPLGKARGVVETVMIVMEDITERVTSEQELRHRADELETAINRRNEEQQEKERKLTVLVNTVYGIKGAHDMRESVDKIVCGFKELGARTTAFALFEDEDMYIFKIHPPDILQKLNSIFRIAIPGIHMRPRKNPGNPFVQTALIGKPTFYRGEREVFGFFKQCFPAAFDNEIAEAAYLFNGQSQAIFPLKTQDATVGAIAISVDDAPFEENFEYFSFLANSAAVEISRQRNSEKLLKSELKYRNLVESSRDMIILCNNDGRIKYSNRIFHELTGLSTKRGKAIDLYSLFPQTHRERVKAVISASVQHGSPTEPLELRMKTQSRGELWIEMMVNSVSREMQGFQIVARDITRRKSLETLVGNLSAFQEKILQNDFIGIITTDLSGKITSWNTGASLILGYGASETLDKNIAEFVINDDSPVYHEFISRDPLSAAQRNREMKMRKKGEGAVDIMYIESAMKDEKDRPIAVIAFFFDNGEKARLEEKWRDLTFRLQQAQLITIVSLAKLAEYRDIETGHHLERIMKYTEILAHELSLTDEYHNYISEDYIVDLVNSCPLHDIGKVGIPDVILHKPARLTPEEFEIIKRHSVIGGDTIAEAEKKVRGRSYLNLGKEIAYYHHEKWDGTGYPQGLKGKDIPLSARIVAVSDVYDALISKRPYKEAFPHETAVGIIRESSGTHFDTAVVDAFCKREDEIALLKGVNLQ
ncbi:MAG: PAS domain S-box protein [Spirochaetes bacterium]|nr:PAS domain S-box protein [Spirochaetota bacterium]